ncbi:SPRYD7 [Blepharisma stoltei]|uniref:SPRY domain-containing protein n=1 Tax=Blepharisma stoltei TaxID=1481888 RepID=A0AAU9JD86_9CILI|nr:unnamed protein product [Blepharisma stoltei]
MFCPFYFKISLFDKVARFILNIDEPQGTELRETKGPPRFTVKIDENLSSSNVKIDEQRIGQHRMTFLISGNGKALANSQLIQDKAYFEVKVIKPGNIGIGVSKNTKNHLNEGVGQDQESWGVLFTSRDGPSIYKVAQGTVIGCLFDQSDVPAMISFTKDDRPIDGAKVSGMKGSVVPAISVSGGAEIEVIFDSQLLEYNPPSGFSPIIFSQNFMF